ncbi:SAM-dependent methyltransferase [Turneriella parva]|uniref:Ribosomal RNA methyltransferase RrmJ/FtsJ n=1 Tax=Turneriella parva (strain ATCC BAA-1111 / DSM 21527 / NCTC 11395 / H) TaxID=869212 RepID=I4B8I2_TURPD|nr:SAM-dependent methyltransferase [Turneriella parva]AFM13589.1 ribosomal RNA methyltransferase RrmJ/FtsJ [Turneriella parva DSM 21527]
MSAGALYFVRDELKAEFADEARFLNLKSREVAPGIIFSEQAIRVFWVLDFWPVDTLDFVSISDAAKKLRQKAKLWAYAGSQNYRRGQLIAEELRARPPKPIVFPPPPAKQTAAAFTLKDGNSLFYSLNPLKGQFAGGTLRFVEDKVGPPSRAYLKLWELLTLTGLRFEADDRVIDLGATPGGWSYVAASCGTPALMIDRSEPDAKLLKKFRQLRFLPGDGLNPPENELATATIIMSDMACEPQKLLHSIRRWLGLGGVRAIICTLKFHGVSDKALIREFADIPGSQIFHLFHNGHELTWVWQRRNL